MEGKDIFSCTEKGIFLQARKGPGRKRDFFFVVKGNAFGVKEKGRACRVPRSEGRRKRAFLRLDDFHLEGIG
jgi:hypothetical protein